MAMDREAVIDGEEGECACIIVMKGRMEGMEIQRWVKGDRCKKDIKFQKSSTCDAD